MGPFLTVPMVSGTAPYDGTMTTKLAIKNNSSNKLFDTKRGLQHPTTQRLNHKHNKFIYNDVI
jgi:hypothetical protein